MNSPIAIYRETLRQAGHLPHPYLQAFVKARAKDYFSRHRNAPEPFKYLKRARADLRRLQSVNLGSQKLFMQLLRHAYGRSGRLRRELLLPHFAEHDSNLSKREQIIPGVENSRPPTYTRTLLALVCNPISKRTAKAISPADVVRPRSLPERADPGSEEARLLGPLSLRRAKNIHHRFFDEELEKVLPPLEVESSLSAEKQTKRGIHIPHTGLERFRPVEMLSRLATPPSLVKPPENSGSTTSPQRSKLGGRSHRWLRRRYRELLAEIPSVQVVPHSSPNAPAAASGKVKSKKQKGGSSQIESIPNPEVPVAKVHVNWASDLALTKSLPSTLRTITKSELKWISRMKPNKSTQRMDSSPTVKTKT